MILTDAATALRVSEVLALQWCDLDFKEHLIRVRRAYVERRFGKPKSKASKAPVPMHPLLAAHLLRNVGGKISLLAIENILVNIALVRCLCRN